MFDRSFGWNVITGTAGCSIENLLNMTCVIYWFEFLQVPPFTEPLCGFVTLCKFKHKVTMCKISPLDVTKMQIPIKLILFSYRSQLKRVILTMVATVGQTCYIQPRD